MILGCIETLTIMRHLRYPVGDDDEALAVLRPLVQVERRSLVKHVVVHHLTLLRQQHKIAFKVVVIACVQPALGALLTLRRHQLQMYLLRNQQNKNCKLLELNHLGTASVVD